jgi:hypothetical protein
MDVRKKERNLKRMVASNITLPKVAVMIITERRIEREVDRLEDI